MARSDLAVLFVFAMLASATALASASDAQTGVTPIQKVLQMMEELKAKAKEEKKAEIQTFNEFTQFCRDTIRDKGYAIKSAGEDIEKLKAAVQKYDTDAMTLGQQVKDLGEAIDAVSHEKALATEVRDKQKRDYRGTHQDYVDQVADMEVGSKELNKMMSATASAASFLQEMSTRSGSKSRQPAEPAIESQSAGVVDMMEGLKEKLLAEKTALEEEEAQTQHAFEMTAQMFDQQIEKNTDERSEKLSQQKAAEASSAESNQELTDTTNTKGEDEKYSAELTTLCEQKSAQFEVRQQTRADELKAIDQAMEIIGGDSVSGAGGKHLPQLLQAVHRRASDSFALAQLRSMTSAQRSQTSAASFLSARAKTFSSRMLSMLAVRASADPFVKVRKMIQDMIAKLQDEASDEAEHKGFCDEELSNNQATRDEKNAKIEGLTANIEEMTAKSSQLSSDITSLAEEETETAAAMAKAMAIRGEEKAKNAATVADAKEAISAVSRAVGVLKDFYAKAATATALLQRGKKGPADDVPATFDEPFQGSGGEGGILGMLDVILSDFQRLEAETTATEAANVDDYKTFMDESAENKETMHKDYIDKKSLRSKTEHNIKLAKKDLKRNQGELDAALEYYEKLKPSCVDAGVSYEDRVAQRENEIASLKDALNILEGQA